MKAALFDFGGTLDTGGVHWSEKYADLYGLFGVPVPKEELERAFVWSEQQLLLDRELPHTTFRHTIDLQLALQFSFLHLDGQNGLRKQMLEGCYRDVLDTASKAGEILREARPRYRLGVVSNFYGNLSMVCAELGLAQYLDVMIDSSRVGVRKPDPEIFRIATRALAVEPHETFVVGDSYDRDIVPSKIIGCRTIWLKGRSWTAPPSTASADYTVANLEEIRPVLSGAATG
jgi:HAD superfamily hydrolase (TIGR01509 family)